MAMIGANQYIFLLEQELDSILKECKGVLGEAMRYAVLDGGKRVRPLCVYHGAKAAADDSTEADTEDLLILGEAIELIHCYSLVHDDMPEMDNDDYRRGKLSVHKKYGAAVALLAGDALLSLSAKLLTECRNRDAAQYIANASLDMVYGQAAELAGCSTREEYLEMYSKKTGALILGAFLAGAACSIGKNGTRKLKDIGAFAEHLGIAFQLADDLLDGGASIADLIGRDETERLLDSHTAKAIEAAGRIQSADELVQFAERLWHRKS